MRYFLLICLLFFSMELFSADINATIANGDKKVYSTLLKNISKDTTSQSEINLQRTLLYKLMAESKSDFSLGDIKSAKSIKEYEKLFKLYVKNLFLAKNLEKKIAANSAKIDTLLTQIHSQKEAFFTTQLFYAFYLKEKKEETLRLDAIKLGLQKIENSLIVSLKKITLNESVIVHNIKDIDDDLKKIDDVIEQLKIKKERYTLLEKEAFIVSISKKIVTQLLQQQKLYKKKMDYMFLLFSAKVKNRHNDLILIHNNIVELLKQDIENGYMIAKDVDRLLLNIEKEFLGSIETFKEQSLQELKREVESLWSMLEQPLFVINKTPISSLKLLLALLIFVIGFFIGSVYKKYIAKLANKNKSISAGSHILLANMGYYTIFLITFFIVLKVLGIDLSSIALVAGALSVGIGFGLQNIISNFVSGIILMVERSVKIGDYIELDNELRGHVVDIKMRSITVNTNSNIDIIVPNQDLIQNRVINWTMNDKIRRFEIPFGVAYGTDPQKVIDIILEAVNRSDIPDLYNTPQKYTRVIMTGMGDSSVNFELFVWIKGKEILSPKRTTSRFLVLIYNTLYAHGIEIPFPQQDLHIRSIDVDLPLKINEDK